MRISYVGPPGQVQGLRLFGPPHDECDVRSGGLRVAEADVYVSWGNRAYDWNHRRDAIYVSYEIGFYEMGGKSREVLRTLSIDGIAGLGWFYRPTDADPLREELPVEPAKEGRPDGYALIIGQKATDRVHCGQNHIAWIGRMAEVARSRGLRPVLRDHPKFPVSSHVAIETTPPGEPLRDCVERAAYTAVHSSSSALKIASWGYPMEAHGPAALVPTCHTPSVLPDSYRKKLFRDLSYRQWYDHEMTPACAGMYLRRALGES